LCRALWSAILIGFAIASRVDETKSLCVIEQRVEDGLCIENHHGLEIPVLSVETFYKDAEMLVITRYATLELGGDGFSLLIEERRSVGRWNREEQEGPGTSGIENIQLHKCQQGEEQELR